MKTPTRGDIWLADLNPTRGHEQGGSRPVLIVSHDTYNRGPAALVVVVPLTKTQRNIPIHVVIEPPEGGLKVRSTALCDAIRSISKDRLMKKLGPVSASIMAGVEERLRVLLDL